MQYGRVGGHGGSVRVKQEIAMADPMRLKVTPGGTLDSYSVAGSVVPFGRLASTKQRLDTQKTASRGAKGRGRSLMATTHRAAER
jgi:hypothetical protein